MDDTLFVICMALGSAAIALWVKARFPRLAPRTIGLALLHVAAAMLAGQLLVPAGLGAAGALGSHAWIVVGLLGVALPALVYAFLACAWMIGLAQGALGRFR